MLPSGQAHAAKIKHSFVSLSNDPGKVESNFFCYAATVLSPHRNVLIFVVIIFILFTFNSGEEGSLDTSLLESAL